MVIGSSPHPPLSIWERGENRVSLLPYWKKELGHVELCSSRRVGKVIAWNKLYKNGIALPLSHCLCTTHSAVGSDEEACLLTWGEAIIESIVALQFGKAWVSRRVGVDQGDPL